MRGKTPLDFDSYKALAFRREGKVLYATMNLPEKRNPASGIITEELIRLFRTVFDDGDVNVIVLGGAGKAFSAGGDIKVMEESLKQPHVFWEYIPESKELVHSMIDCPKPIISAVAGPAIGLGATIALYADMIFATDDAKIGDAHIKLGLTPGDGGSAIWPLLIGFARAKQYLFTGDNLTGKKAAEIGLINDSFPTREALDEFVAGFAQKLAKMPPTVLQFTKLGINIPLKATLTSVFDATMAYEMAANFTRDHKEAVMAFIEQREPVYTGE